MLGTVIVITIIVILVSWSLSTSVFADKVENNYTVIAIYVAREGLAKSLDLLRIINCSDSLKAAIYSSNDTRAAIVVLYAQKQARYSVNSITACLQEAIGKAPKNQLYIPLSARTIAAATIVQAAKEAAQTTTSNTSQITRISPITMTTIPTTTRISWHNTSTQKKAITSYSIVTTSTTRLTTSATTPAPVSILTSYGNTQTGSQALNPSKRLAIVLGTAVLAAILVYMAWRIRGA